MLPSTKLTALIATVAASNVLAQVAPDAGQTIRELTRPDAALQAPDKDAPEIQVAPDVEKMVPEGTKIPVKAFKVTGSSVFTPDELGSLLQEWVGRDLSLADMQAAAASISRYYRDRGYIVARAYIPAQTMQDGTVEIAVLEGQLGKVTLQNTSRVSDQRAEGMATPARSADALYGPVLERNLLLLNETPGIGSAKAALQPGASVGLSDLMVVLEPGPLVSGAIDLDNHGNRYTGAYRLGATLNVNSPLRLGDQITARVIASDEQLYYGRVAYRVPVTRSGLTLGAAWSQSSYRLGRNFAVLDAHGDVSIASVFLTYPFVRSRAFNVTGTLSADDKVLEDRVESVLSVSSKNVKTVTAGVAVNRQGYSGAYNFSVGYTAGKLDIESPETRAADALTARTQGDYNKLTYAASALLPVSGPWSLYGAGNGQWTHKNLDSSEKFSLGGADGVRAYPQGEASGDQGYLLTGELRYTFSTGSAGTMQLAAFVDHGRVRINRRPFAQGDNHRHLSATGFSLHWLLDYGVYIKANLAWKAGSAEPTSDLDKSPRGWIQAVKYF
jgi:hemolysin activation/secretion protein